LFDVFIASSTALKSTRLCIWRRQCEYNATAVDTGGLNWTRNHKNEEGRRRGEKKKKNKKGFTETAQSVAQKIISFMVMVL